MYSIRVTKPSSGNSAVQVVWYEQRRLMIATHLGSAHNPEELADLKQKAAFWISQNENQGQIALFSPPQFALPVPTFSLNDCQFLGTQYSFIYDCLNQLSLIVLALVSWEIVYCLI